MRVVVLHSQLFEGAGRDEEDVLVQVQVVSHALARLGYEPIAVAFSIDIKATIDILKRIRPAFVFNLVETVEGTGRLIHLAPSILDHLGIAYTGAGCEAVFLTSNKLLAKNLLMKSGIATPTWLSREEVGKMDFLPWPACIIKSIWEHASVGLDEDSIVVTQDPQILLKEMESRLESLGGGCFVEAYVDGREFNISILAGERGPEVLPPGEICFDLFPQGKAKLVGYRAKWEPDSFEYNSTPRSFDFPTTDSSLLHSLKNIAKECWTLFGLRGYARVDFRVDRDGKPWVLEVNTNPCLSPDAGFAAAAGRGSLDYNQVVNRIIKYSL